MAKRDWQPSNYPVRTPTDLKQEIGRMNNPPRTLKIGGVGEARLIDTAKQQKGTTRTNSIGPVSDRGGRSRR